MRTLVIRKEGVLFEVDDPAVPGMPPVGRGRTILEAIGDWTRNNADGLEIKFDVSPSAERATGFPYSWEYRA